MSSTCFEPKGSSSGRRLYIQVRYSVFYMHHYKTACITCFECVPVFLPQLPNIRKAHASYYITICVLSGSTTFFPHYLINGTIFGKKSYQHKMCVCLSLQLSSETFLRRTERDMIKNVYRICSRNLRTFFLFWPLKNRGA